MKNVFLPLIISVLLFAGCGENQQNRHTDLYNTIFYETESVFYIDPENYPAENKSLPIGIFDSGTGGLTVMEVILKADLYDNQTGEPGPDGIRDFENENFIYLGDQANMPYGNYAGANKTELLEEHIIKDVQFLMGKNYYETGESENFSVGKNQVKAIVIACNTATAFGKDIIDDFIKMSGTGLSVTGVIGAGCRGALDRIKKDESCTIGVMATAGTVASEGYVKTLNRLIKEGGFSGSINIVQQAGIGLAGAIDGEPGYIMKSAESVRNDYKGPVMGEAPGDIRSNILKRYNFEYNNNELLYSGERENPETLQLNSIQNYISYHLVSLLEKIRNLENPEPLKSIILGCTHYPFYEEIFLEKIEELRNYKEDGEFIYKPFMSDDISLIDPAENTASELFENLRKNKKLSDKRGGSAEFFISVPNMDNPSICVDIDGRFTWDYKYGRHAGDIQEYVKRIPFNGEIPGKEILERLKLKIPVTWEFIRRQTGN